MAEKNWKKTASLACIGTGGVLVAVGNFFGGSLDLSAGIVQMLDALATVLGAFGIGTLVKSGGAAEKSDAE